MALSSTTTRQTYTGDGVTVAFAFTFPVQDAAWVKVDLDGAEQAMGFTVTLNADQVASPGGTVAFIDPPASAAVVRIRRRTPRTQGTAFGAYTPFPAKSVEGALDKAVMVVQDVEADLQADVAQREEVLRADFSVLENAAQTVASVTDAASSAGASADAAWSAASLTQADAWTFRANGVRQARAICLRAGLKSRRTFGSINGWKPSGNGAYAAIWLRDTYMQARPFPGWFTAAYLRPIVDAFMGTIGGNVTFPNSPAERIELDGSPTYFGGPLGAGYGDLPSLDSPAYLAMLVAVCHERGDTTVYTTHKTKLLQALGSVPLGANELIYSDPLGAVGYSVGWGFEDQINLTGELAMVSALQAVACRRLVLVARSKGDTAGVATFQAAADAIVTGLANMRRSDGWYKPSSNTDLPHAMLTCLMVAEGLCTTAEAAVSARAVAVAYRAGLLTERGAMRHLVSPNYWGAVTATTVNTYQNGGFWLGEWLTWLAKTIQLDGDRAGATKVYQDAVEEILREHRIDGTAPFEWSYGSTRSANNLYGAAAAFLADVVDAGEGWLSTQMSGAVGASKLIHLPAGHTIVGCEVLANGASTVTVTLYGADQTAALGDTVGAPPLTFGGESTILTVALSAAVGGRTLTGAIPKGVHGGYVRAAVTSGSATGDLSIRLLTAPVAAAWTGVTDDFSSDTSSSYTTSGTWTISSGRLRNSLSSDGQRWIRTSVVSADIEVQAVVRSANLGTRFPQLVLRYVDASNLTFILISSGAIKVYDRVAGVDTQQGADIGVALLANTDYTVKAKVVGTNVTVTYNGTDYTRTIGRASVAGRGGLRVGSAGTGEIQFDDLVVTGIPAAVQPVPPGMCMESSALGQVSGETYPVDTSGGLRDEFGTLVVGPPILGTLAY